MPKFRLRLCVIGCLDLSFFRLALGSNPLRPCSVRSARQYVHFDVNLAPLESTVLFPSKSA